jgi:hypothetical protein
MAYSQTPKSSKSNQGSTAATSSSSSTAVVTTPCGCGCGCGGHTHLDGCCKLTCFERPAYFCGQLLSDTDLTLQETYFREKNKLYHRTLDGFGVVCGLRMKCDCHCKGHIIIGDGFAIDCCGNDLVVCQPASFDVIAALRKKQWLLEAPEDCCEEKEYRERERDCRTRQCFYIGICYSEEPIDYVTPYTTECSPGPGPCQPTRVREGVRFEIYDQVPLRPDPLEEIEERIERCFRIFCEGQFARGLQRLAPCILEILCSDKEGEKKKTEHQERGEEARLNPHRLFEELRALFLHQLRICPDQYNCDLEYEVCKLCAPCWEVEGEREIEREAKREKQRARAREEERENVTARECFTKLLELIQRYVFSCVLAEFAFLCPEPPEPCCVLIGSVEIENGRLTRVINYPRWYLWSFANFFEVLIYTLANEAACGREFHPWPPERDEQREGCNEGCCPEFEVDVCTFLELFVAENRAPEYAALASVKAIQAMRRALVAGFDFIKPRGIALAALEHMPFERAHVLAKRFGFPLHPAGKPSSEIPDPLSALLSNLIHRGPDPIAVFQTGKDAPVTSATRIMDAPARSEYLVELEARIAALESKLKEKPSGRQEREK